MGETYSEIPPKLIEWIQKQHMFWVASAPLSASGHVNISPKGVAGTFHVESSTQVWYEDLSGSGAETIAHIRENGRVTILFNAFDGPPRITRLYGTGSFYELGSPEYEALLPAGTRQPGSRAIVVVDVYEVGTTCGYSVPYYSFVGHRTPLLDWAARKEAIDLTACKTTSRPLPLEPIASIELPSLEAKVEGDSEAKSRDSSRIPSVVPHPNGMLSWWKDRNTLSLDGLPALDLAFKQPASAVGIHVPVRKARQSALNEYPPSKQPADESPTGTSDVRRFLWNWAISFILWVRWFLVLPIHLFSPTITSLVLSASRLLSKNSSKFSSRKAALAASPSIRSGGTSVSTPRTVLVHGEEIQEAFSEAGEVQGPPVSWGVKNNDAKGNHQPGVGNPAGGPTTTSFLPTSTPHGALPVLLGYGASFLLGMIFMRSYSEIHTVGIHAAAMVLGERRLSISPSS